MTTRILTLFDDDFFSQEEQESETAKKEPEVKQPAKADTAQSDSAEDKKTKDELRELEQNEQGEDTHQNNEDKKENVVKEVPGIVLHKELPPAPVTHLPGKEELSDAINNTEEKDNQTIEQELNNQLLSELIQVDYTAFIHRELPSIEKKDDASAKDKQIGVELPSAEKKNDLKENLNPVAIVAPDEEDEIYEDVTPLPEWKLDKKYYTIGEVAQLFSVNTSHIRFWTNEFKLKPRTTRKGDRLYNPKEIAELRLIHHLVKVKKHTIKGAREKLKAGKDEVAHNLDLKEALSGLKNMLVQIKEQL